MTLFRRFLLLVSLAFWQGGFMFYGGVVVPTGTAVLGSEVEQGFITQAVTNYLNYAGAVCVLLWCITLWLDLRQTIQKRIAWARISWGLWIAIAAALAALMALHVPMDRLLNVADHTVLDEGKFLRMHEAYLTIISLQWAACLLLLLLTLHAWRTLDATSPRPAPG
jgi:hypothetical protein